MSSDLRMLELLGGMAAMKTGQGTHPNSITNPADDPAYQAFDMHMKMMQQVLAPEADGVKDSLGMGGMGSMNGMATMGGMGFEDDRMYDALATISRLFNRQRLTRGTLTASQVQQTASYAPKSVPNPPPMHDTGRVKADNTVYEVVGGELSAVFESGTKGPGCIGYDKVGGTSYGTFQIASRTGTMDRFVKYLEKEAPDVAQSLGKGPFNTGSKRGSAPRAWKRIAALEPKRFEALQRDFIRQDHYAPAREKILTYTGVDIDQAPFAVQEVLWSTSVQHGATGAARIFRRAISSSTGATGEPDFERLVSKVYDNRKHQFDSSTSRVRRSVQSRLTKEQNIALSMLKGSRHMNEVV